MLEPELAVAGLRGLLSDPRIVGTLFAALIAALAVWASGIVGTKLHLPGPYITVSRTFTCGREG